MIDAGASAMSAFCWSSVQQNEAKRASLSLSLSLSLVGSPPNGTANSLALVGSVMTLDS